LRKKQQAARANVGFYKMARYRAAYVAIIKEQMAGYGARLAAVSRAQAVRRANDQWDGGERFANGNVALVYDELGNGLIFRDPVMTGVELLGLIEGEFRANPRLARDRLGYVQSSLLGQSGEAFNIYDEGLDFSDFSFFGVAKNPYGSQASIAPYLRALREMRIGGKGLLPGSMIDVLGMSGRLDRQDRARSVADYRDMLLASEKYPAELGLFRHGLHLTGDVSLHDTRYVFVRRGSQVGNEAL